ncbi:MAG: nicotinate (nicotinamide) nucleotide adenylyltransferase [Elusimicrobia bacterium]|nr:nicotinate (nicotinamide) nucleotide adenylyltransferase [Elusimicrobiota bacterium]
MKFGILGGSFDPVHNAHIQMAETALKEFNLDKIIFVPAFVPPHKSNLFASDKDRYNMLYNVIKNIDKYEIDTYEIDSKKTVYSYQMLDYFRSKYKLCDIKMIIGADSFNNLSTWKNIEYIVKEYGFIVFIRPGIKINTESPYYNYCAFSKYIMKNISSTTIRQKLKNKEDISQYVPKQVFEYIKKKNLYNE